MAAGVEAGGAVAGGVEVGAVEAVDESSDLQPATKRAPAAQKIKSFFIKSSTWGLRRPDQYITPWRLGVADGAKRFRELRFLAALRV
jgi:hypothetical protein